MKSDLGEVEKNRVDSFVCKLQSSQEKEVSSEASPDFTALSIYEIFMKKYLYLFLIYAFFFFFAFFLYLHFFLIPTSRKIPEHLFSVLCLEFSGTFLVISPLF